jgi:hypothetical protein
MSVKSEQNQVKLSKDFRALSRMHGACQPPNNESLAPYAPSVFLPLTYILFNSCANVHARELSGEFVRDLPSMDSRPGIYILSLSKCDQVSENTVTRALK